MGKDFQLWYVTLLFIPLPFLIFFNASLGVDLTCTIRSASTI